MSETQTTEPTVQSPPVPGGDGFQIPVATFIAQHLMGTSDEVWAKWIKNQHRHQVGTVAEWHARLNSHRDAPAHPLHPAFTKG